MHSQHNVKSLCGKYKNAMSITSSEPTERYRNATFLSAHKLATFTIEIIYKILKSAHSINLLDFVDVRAVLVPAAFQCTYGIDLLVDFFVPSRSHYVVISLVCNGLVL